MNHWAEKYIGKPWVSGAHGPDSFDCWGLLCAVYRENYAVELTKYPGIEECGAQHAVALFQHEAQNPEWVRVEKPSEGCAVAIGFINEFHHVGIYVEVDGGVVLHSYRKRGVVAQSVASLRLLGLHKIEFYRHARARY